MSERDESTAPEGAEENAKAESRDERSGFLGRLQSAWKDTVGTYATDEGETKNLFERLVDFGELSKDEALRMVNETKDRIEQNRKELDARVDESIKRTVSRMTLPSSQDIKTLGEKLDRIEERISKLEQSKR